MEREVLARLLPLLRRAGVTVVAGTQKDLVLRVPGDLSAAQVDMKAVRQRLSPSMTNRGIDGIRTLYVAPSAAPDVIAAAAAGRFDLVTDDPELVIVGGEVLLQSEEPKRRPGSGKPAWGRNAILRVLALASRPLQQSELAAAVGVSQQAVSLALSRLSSFVTRDEHGWSALDGALESWVREYPGPGGTVGYWYGLDDPATQASTALKLLDELGLNAVVSGDLAADTYAPWQLPTTVRMYLPEIIDFTVVGFSPVEPNDATMTIVVPEDPTIAHVAAAFGTRYGARHFLADAAITLWDLLNISTAPTAGEAADRLRDAIRSGGLGA
ncbi:hypothetical protein [Nocardia sp. CDC160]|uniref:hypothetical protein n=1 Tax=Nocardia sp. CDC160 TaxID=3112166 RepID=UPI002DC00B10|nr:hypothetical protein [Nocardia sp. CDC160]MEC3915979.1 hypothetical protein [Nocardia sp. CDC160]